MHAGTWFLSPTRICRPVRGIQQATIAFSMLALTVERAGRFQVREEELTEARRVAVYLHVRKRPAVPPGNGSHGTLHAHGCQPDDPCDHHRALAHPFPQLFALIAFDSSTARCHHARFHGYRSRPAGLDVCVFLFSFPLVRISTGSVSVFRRTGSFELVPSLVVFTLPPPLNPSPHASALESTCHTSCGAASAAHTDMSTVDTLHRRSPSRLGMRRTGPVHRHGLDDSPRFHGSVFRPFM